MHFFGFLFYCGACIDTYFGIQKMRILFCFPKVVQILSSSQLVTCSSITAAAFFKYKMYSTSLLLHNVQFSSAKCATNFFIWSRSFYRINETVLKSLGKVSRLPTWWWSDSSRVLLSLLPVASHTQSESVVRAIKKISYEDDVDSPLIALRALLQYGLFICTSMFLSLNAQLFSGTLKKRLLHYCFAAHPSFSVPVFFYIWRTF